MSNETIQEPEHPSIQGTMSYICLHIYILTLLIDRFWHLLTNPDLNEQFIWLLCCIFLPELMEEELYKAVVSLTVEVAVSEVFLLMSQP